MIRTQIQLIEEQMRRLKRAARLHGISIAEAIRRLIDRGIEEELPDRTALYEGASRWVGAFRDMDEATVTDVSTHHDRYLEDLYR